MTSHGFWKGGCGDAHHMSHLYSPASLMLHSITQLFFSSASLILTLSGKPLYILKYEVDLFMMTYMFTKVVFGLWKS